MNSSRRNFIHQALALLFAGAGLGAFLNACGGSSGTSSGGTATTSGGNCQANGTAVSIGSNHGHGSPAISAADVIQGTEASYIVAAGTAGHSHTLTVTDAMFAALKNNTGVTMTTDADNTGHTHAITVNCA